MKNLSKKVLGQFLKDKFDKVYSNLLALDIIVNSFYLLKTFMNFEVLSVVQSLPVVAKIAIKYSATIWQL